MSTYNRLNKLMKNSKEIVFDNASKIVLISDCHRGDGSWVDDFSHNQNIYYAAIEYYYHNNYTYIDLGDSDELWKNKSFEDVSVVYTDVFHLLHNFYKENRYYMIYGNHDIVKKEKAFREKYMTRFYNSNTDSYEPLFDNIEAYESLILVNGENKNKYLLIHGHQGDLLSDILWRFGRYLSRYVWRRLEIFGFRDPTSAAKSYAKKKKVEKKIIEWIAHTNQPVIAGHTHRPNYPAEYDLPYYNVGSCVHPTCITAMEIENSIISLVRWDIRTNDDRVMYVNREVIAPPKKL